MNASGKAEGWGVESAKAYAANLEAYRQVHEQRKSAENFLRAFYLQWKKAADLSMNKPLRAFLDRESSFEEERLPLQDWMKLLKDTGLRELGLDLGNILEQKDWPTLVRYFRLRSLDGKIDTAKVAGEKQRFLTEAASLKAQSATLKEVEAVFEAADQHDLPPYKTRFVFERLMDQLPEDFSFEVYPNLRFFLQQIILLSELKSDTLREEIRALTEKLTAQLVKTDEDGQLVTILRDYRLLKKLFQLGLSREEFRELQARKITPEKLITSLKLTPHRLARITSLLGTAIQFYEGAIERERWMMQKALERMRESKQTKAALITGGFHTEGLREKILSSGSSYIEIAPRINEVTPADQKKYLKTLLGRKAASRSYIAPKVRSEIRFWQEVTPQGWRREWATTGARASGIVGSIDPQGGAIVRQRFIDTAVGSSRSEARTDSSDKQKGPEKTRAETSPFGEWIEYRVGVQTVFDFANAVNDRFLKTIAHDNIALELAGPIASFGPRSEARRLKSVLMAGLVAIVSLWTAATAKAQTVFPGKPILQKYDIGSTSASMTQYNSSRFQWNFSVSGENHNSYSIAVINFMSGGGPQNLSLHNEIKFLMRGWNSVTSGNKGHIYVEFKDADSDEGNDDIARLTFSGIGSENLETITIDRVALAALYPKVDWTQIKEIVFKTPTATYPYNYNGWFEVKTGGLYFSTNIEPNSSLTLSDITPLPGTPQPTTVSPVGATVTTTPISNGIRVDYNNGSESWSGGGIELIGTGDLSGFSNLVFAVNGNPSQVKMEIVDDQESKESD